ncbi:acyl-CoA-like ligand-binding transcription factor [Mycobacterium botniense]
MQPPDLSLTRALHRACETTVAMSEGQREFEKTRQRLIFSIPELKAAMHDEYLRTVTVIAKAVSRRIGCEPHDFEVRVFSGALTGAMMAAFDRAPGTPELVYRALDFLDAGMPLS